MAALAIWAGAAITGAPLTIAAAVAGALNTAPIAWLSVGAAAFPLGWLPPAVGAIGALPVVGGFLLNVLTQGMHAPVWVVNLSPFAVLPAVPDVPPDWAIHATLIIVTAIMTAIGLAGYARRDLTT